MKKSSIWVAGLSAACLISSSSNIRAEDAPAWRKDADTAIDKGLAWLAANESAEIPGCWGDPKFPAVSGLALWAMAGSGDPQYKPQMDRAVAFLRSCVRDDGGIYVENPGRKGGGLGNYNTSICLTALHAARGNDPELLPVLLNARAYVATSQFTGDPDDDYYGGFGYDKANDRVYTDLMNTHFSIEAIRRTQGLEDLRPAGQARADVNWNAALEYVTKLQSKESDDAGGFFYNPTDAKAGTRETEDGKVRINAYGSITYAGFLSMIFCEVKRDDPRVVSTVDYAAKHWTLEENPGLDQGSLYFYMNVMGRALSTANMDAIPRKDGGAAIQWRAELAARLKALQKEDGSWSNTDSRWWESDPSLVTSYALLALEYARGSAK
jgi:squalene-hopene/tetraprenyl-beta-curcumene cyclase